MTAPKTKPPTLPEEKRSGTRRCLARQGSGTSTLPTACTRLLPSEGLAGWMLNVVTGPVGYPAAVLIRSAVHKSQTLSAESLTLIEEIAGPARLTKFLNIDKRFNNKKSGIKTGLWIERGVRVTREKIKRTPRIGVAYAGHRWAKKPYRFIFEPLP